MPIYEYECRKCGEKFEAFRSISSDDNEVKCLKCGQRNARRIMSKFGTCSGGGDSCSLSAPT
ncbi:zinc ribbon domain-containing protein [Chloroflexota bacterium]